MKALIDYLEQLTVTQGDLVGEPVTVFPWERKFLKGAFAPGVSTSALSIGRGNGKTSFIAAIAAAALDGPLAQPRSEILLVASNTLTSPDCLSPRSSLFGRPESQ